MSARLCPASLKRPSSADHPAAVSKSHLHPRKIIPGSRGLSKMAVAVFRYRNPAKLIGLPCTIGRFRLWTAVDIQPLNA
jgi:hypothetical protein